MYAVRRSGPPKQMFVVSGSSVARCSTVAPSGETDVMPPLTSVAMLTQPSPSTPSESNSWYPGSPTSSSAPPGPSGFGPSGNPGDDTFHAHARPVCVSATYTRSWAGDSPMPFGPFNPSAYSVMDEPSGFA